MPGSWSLRPLAWLLFAGLCVAQSTKELTINQPSANVLFFSSGEYVVYEFNVLADNSRLEFRVTLTESPEDVLDVYLSDQPINTSTPELSSNYSVMSGPIVASTSNEGGADCQVGKQCMIYVLSVSPCVVKAGTYYGLVVGSSVDVTTKAKVRYEEVSAELEPSVPVSRYVSYHEPVARRWHYFALTPSPDKGAHATPSHRSPLSRARHLTHVPSSLCPQLPPVSPLLTTPLPLHRAPSQCAHTHTPFPVPPLTLALPWLPPLPCQSRPRCATFRCPPPRCLTLAVPCRSGRDQPHRRRQLRPFLHGALRR